MSLISEWGCNHDQAVRRVFDEQGYSNSTTSSTSPNRRRKAACAQRIRLYRNRAAQDFHQLIDHVFVSSVIKKQRKKFVEYAAYQNITKRIVDEVASLYNAPALRKLATPQATDAYRSVIREVGYDRIAQHAQRMLMLCNEVLIWSTIKSNGKVKLRLITPDLFSAVADREGDLLAIVLDRAEEKSTGIVLFAGNEKISYDVWDDTYRYGVNAAGNIIEMTEHKQGRIPCVLMHAHEPHCGELLASDIGSDITSAHLAVFFINMMVLRLAKSQGERQPYISGDAPNVMSTNQAADGEAPLVLPPNVIVGMLESKTTPEHYMETKRDILISVGQTYGLSYEQMTLSGETSGVSLEQRREKLKELRNEQRVRAVEHEYLICKMLGFDASSLTVDFSEQTLPLDESAAVALLKEKAAMGLDSPVAFLMRKDPDLTEVTAMELLRKNIANRAIVVELARSLNIANDASVENPGNSPLQNGVNNFASDGARSGNQNGNEAANS